LKTKAEAHDVFDEWLESGMCGNVIFYHAPKSDGVEAIIEQVVKVREMKPTTRAAFRLFMDDLMVERGEVVRDKDGNPDRIKLTRRYDIG
jgi:hypothetical protein